MFLKLTLLLVNPFNFVELSSPEMFIGSPPGLPAGYRSIIGLIGSYSYSCQPNGDPTLSTKSIVPFLTPVVPKIAFILDKDITRDSNFVNVEHRNPNS